MVRSLNSKRVLKCQSIRPGSISAIGCSRSIIPTHRLRSRRPRRRSRCGAIQHRSCARKSCLVLTERSYKARPKTSSTFNLVGIMMWNRPHFLLNWVDERILQRGRPDGTSQIADVICKTQAIQLDFVYRRDITIRRARFDARPECTEPAR